MQLLKIDAKDLDKLMKEIKASRRVSYINISSDGPTLKFSFENDIGRLVTVTLFDESRSCAPTLAESRSL
jgi:type IV secretory pathway ATPase VirB11/archaellum biosynthesis ATPase